RLVTCQAGSRIGRMLPGQDQISADTFRAVGTESVRADLPEQPNAPFAGLAVSGGAWSLPPAARSRKARQSTARARSPRPRRGPPPPRRSRAEQPAPAGAVRARAGGGPDA